MTNPFLQRRHQKKWVAKTKLKKLRRKYQNIQKTIRGLHQKLNKIANKEAQSTTPKVVTVATQTEICEGRENQTQIEPIFTQRVATQTNFHVDLTDTTVQMKGWSSHNKRTQTEGWSSHNKRIQTESIPSHCISNQTEEKFKDTPSRSNPILWKLQKELAQSKLALKQYRNETVPLQNYQELRKLDKVMDQIDTIFSLYLDVLSCRSPAMKYALFLLERYLLLKIKDVKAGNQ